MKLKIRILEKLRDVMCGEYDVKNISINKNKGNITLKTEMSHLNHTDVLFLLAFLDSKEKASIRNFKVIDKNTLKINVKE
jgi:hypothetical protein